MKYRHLYVFAHKEVSKKMQEKSNSHALSLVVCSSYREGEKGGKDKRKRKLQSNLLVGTMKNSASQNTA